ncbi:two pore domain potassium channel family protein [Streptomyces sp. M2CJ-2]|uniref:potassium channel family protein n=1 Tax=Streptomyces sp. M2CJ-2 TaxID=2803948 RepID=UPI001923BF1F|nr:potassium channel family protein [Streptomyces sp. M2CJ-2]MBL3665173.1 two pore domain potassium channel family protein [Streptomyces sp. M2CJ-2]
MDSGHKPFTPRTSLWRWLAQAVGATLMVTAYFLLPLDGLGPQRPALSWTFFVLALALIAALLLQQIVHVLLNHPHARPGLVIPLLMCLAILVFATAYQALARQPGEMIGLSTRLDALYFTLVTLATVGYGDITPHGQTARLVAMLQILYTFIFLTAAATALSRQLRTAFLRRESSHRDSP